MPVVPVVNAKIREETANIGKLEEKTHPTENGEEKESCMKSKKLAGKE